MNIRICLQKIKVMKIIILMCSTLIIATATFEPSHIINTDLNKISYYEGDDINMSCVTYKSNNPFKLTWIYPDKSRQYDSVVIPAKRNLKQGISYLLMKNVTTRDHGNYSCKITYVKENITEVHQKTIKIYKKRFSFIYLSEKSNNTKITINAGNNVRLLIVIDSFPEANILWYNNKNQEITTSFKYIIKTNDTSSLLQIYNLTLSDMGDYRIEAVNEFERKNLTLELIVNEKPKIIYKSQKDNYHAFGTNATVKCKVTGHPKPKIFWTFRPCEMNNCSLMSEHERRLEKNEFTNVELDEITIDSYATVYVNQSGEISCRAEEDGIQNTDPFNIFVSEIKKGFGIVETPDFVAVGDDVILTCITSIYKNITDDDIQWYRSSDNNDTILIPDDKPDDIAISYERTVYSHKKILTIRNISKPIEGTYQCKLSDNSSNVYLMDSRTLTIKDVEKPIIVKSNMNDSTVTFNLGQENVYLECKSKGFPTPTMIWFKDDVEQTYPQSNERIRLLNNGVRLEFKFMRDEDHGKYTCKAINKFGSDIKTMELISAHVKFNRLYLAIIVCMVVIFITLFSAFVYKIRKEKEFRKELSVTGLLNFVEGATESLNPELGVDDQAELLPYDTKWEFPREKLKIGKQLGSGAFGVVMKALAQGIVQEEESTTVAVKMVKKTAEPPFIKALASELKIMVHLGQHLNIVNLLGACTKNVAKRELYVIVEYCRFGNLHNYLQRHRENFINQINPKNGFIDKTIGRDIINRKYSVYSRSSSVESSSQSYVQGNNDINVSMLPNGNDNNFHLTNSDGLQPEWRSNYRGDYNYSREVRPIATQDLLSWGFQIARGMEYLASRKILHGDLAARNILLADNEIVKICDFGLAKSMYNCDNYEKKGNVPLPVKWMAPESIMDRIFSTQSDIWSFGIVLWEFFSLAKTPYPGIELNERFFQNLINGYRMEIPMYANKRIYEMMSKCWLDNPNERPSFSDLAETLGDFLDEGVINYYKNLNNSFVERNTKFFAENGGTDYLTMLCPPDYKNLTSSRFKEIVDEPDELTSMIPQIHKNPFPRIETKSNQDEFVSIELETKSSAPIFPNAVSNMGYKCDFRINKLYLDMSPKIPNPSYIGPFPND